jgi:predicted glycoside hydrolase/deacetylase ChbG (UPF0249 family)
VRIVVNADDFGLSDDTVQATIGGIESGLITSASIMARMPATESALAYAATRGDVSFGVHLTFVGTGPETAVSDAADIPALAESDGQFRRTRDIRLAALLHRVPVAQIARETEAQIAVVRSAGVAVSHVDSHRHLHKFAPFREALRRVLPRFGITRVRTVQDVYLERPLRSPTYWLGRAWRRSLQQSFTTTDHFYMPTSAGDREWHTVVERLDAREASSIEVGLHPGHEEEWRRSELASLERFVEVAQIRGHELVPWTAITRS